MCIKYDSSDVFNRHIMKKINFIHPLEIQNYVHVPIITNFIINK